MNSSQPKTEKRESDSLDSTENDRKRPCSANDSGASEAGDGQDDSRRTSRRKKGKVIYLDVTSAPDFNSVSSVHDSVSFMFSGFVRNIAGFDCKNPYPPIP